MAYPLTGSPLTASGGVTISHPQQKVITVTRSWLTTTFTLYQRSVTTKVFGISLPPVTGQIWPRGRG